MRLKQAEVRQSSRNCPGEGGETEKKEATRKTTSKWSPNRKRCWFIESDDNPNIHPQGFLPEQRKQTGGKGGAT